MIAAWILATWLYWPMWPGHFPLVGVGPYVLVVEETTYIEEEFNQLFGPHLRVLVRECDDVEDEHQCGWRTVWNWR